MGAVKDLWESERGLLTVCLVVASTVLVGLGRMPVDTWVNYTTWVFGIYVGGKTLTGAVALVKGNPQPFADKPAETPPAPTPAPTP